jgi:hypothetical protein|tara:strand:+ start:7291 stop:7644 length:354 start_codon:yes stop_codon:yes gene_type:complete
MNKIHVVNKRDHASTDKDFYIGRGSIFGNPYTSKPLDKSKAIYQAESKGEALSKYGEMLEAKIESKEKVIVEGLNEMLDALKQGDIYLVCYCAPKMCHGDIIKVVLLHSILKHLMPK